MQPVTREKPPPTHGERREAIQQRLLLAVNRLLADGTSYTELSIERIVAEAGTSRSTFYVYFDDKSTLLRALTDALIANLLAAAGRWWELGPRATKAEIHTALGELVATYRDHQALMAAVVDTVPHDGELRRRFGALMEVSTARVADHIRDAQAHGGADPSLDPDRTAGWLTWMCERGLYQLLRPVDGAAAARLTTALSDVVWNTLYRAARG